jgi:DNA-binding transcriptional ArsR family regulator
MTPFDVLAEPTRRRILDLLLERPHMVGELTEQLGLTQPGTSKHLRVLREAGLVQVRQDAQRRWYELRPEPLIEIDEWLTPYRWLWQERLDALERHLDAMPDIPDTERTDPHASSGVREHGEVIEPGSGRRRPAGNN